MPHLTKFHYPCFMHGATFNLRTSTIQFYRIVGLIQNSTLLPLAPININFSIEHRRTSLLLPAQNSGITLYMDVQVSRDVGINESDYDSGLYNF